MSYRKYNNKIALGINNLAQFQPTKIQTNCYFRQNIRARDVYFFHMENIRFTRRDQEVYFY